MTHHIISEDLKTFNTSIPGLVWEVIDEKEVPNEYLFMKKKFILM
jgi:hypothetical protein